MATSPLYGPIKHDGIPTNPSTPIPGAINLMLDIESALAALSTQVLQDVRGPMAFGGTSSHSQGSSTAIRGRSNSRFGNNRISK